MTGYGSSSRSAAVVDHGKTTRGATVRRRRRRKWRRRLLVLLAIVVCVGCIHYASPGWWTTVLASVAMVWKQPPPPPRIVLPTDVDKAKAVMVVVTEQPQKKLATESPVAILERKQQERQAPIAPAFASLTASHDTDDDNYDSPTSSSIQPRISAKCQLPLAYLLSKDCSSLPRGSQRLENVLGSMMQ